MNAPDQMPDRVSLLWLLFRWLPAALMVSLLTVWSLVMLGGIARVIGWLFAVFMLPWVGLFFGLLIGLYALFRRRISRPMVVAWALMIPVLVPGFWEHGLFFPQVFPASTEPVAELHLPTDQAMRVGWGGDTLETNYHALYPDQRYAYDLLIEPAAHQKPELSAYGCYGVPVLAPAAGKVVLTHDGDPESVPGELASTENTAGNHVWIELPAQTYVLLAHLQPGSVVVKRDQKVEVGQVLGACGNSGRTSEPHVHLHHQREDPRTHPPGLAEGLPIRFVGVEGPAQPKGGIRREGDTIELTGDLLRPTKTSTRSSE